MTQDIVNRLRTNRDCLAPCLMDEAADEIVRLETALLAALHQRDEARREVCIRSIMAQTGNRAPVEVLARKLAEDIRGWDCFKEDGK